MRSIPVAMTAARTVARAIALVAALVSSPALAQAPAAAIKPSEVIQLFDGRIMIQSEGAEIYFRRIELRPL